MNVYSTGVVTARQQSQTCGEVTITEGGTTTPPTEGGLPTGLIIAAAIVGLLAVGYRNNSNR